ncbi:MAG: hypothetical protein PPHEMADE_2583 [uncultured Paraburkholderia sp.]|nr:MAG: hypothetical protein PPHEMADE_2583 [uncultured Paraburkholderia sp.]
MIDPKKLLRPMCFFLLVVCASRRGRLSLFFLRGRGCGKTLNYKGICDVKSKSTRLGAQGAAKRLQSGFKAPHNGADVRAKTRTQARAKRRRKKPEQVVRV